MPTADTLPPCRAAVRGGMAGRAGRGLVLLAGVLAAHAVLLTGAAPTLATAAAPAPPVARTVVWWAGPAVAPAAREAALQTAALAAPTAAAPVAAPARQAQRRPEAQADRVEPAVRPPEPSQPPLPPQDAPEVPAEPAGWQIAQAAPTSTPAPPGAPPALSAPVYPVRLPAAFVWQYRLSRGLLYGEGVLRWAPAGNRYEALLEGRVLGAELIEFRSSGGFDAAGLAPERFTDRRRGRETLAANFQRDKGVVSFSGPTVQWPLPAGAQDRLSWLVQLAGIAAARPGGLKAGDRILMPVFGARGDGSVWVFSVQARERVALDGEGLPAAVDAWKIQRVPDRPHDTRAEAWLDPQRQHLPVRVRLSQDGGDALDLRLRAIGPP